VPKRFLTALGGLLIVVAANPLFAAYDTPQRAFGISAVDDQQAAGLIMKLAGGSYLWAIITSMFFVWAARHEKAQANDRTVTEREIANWNGGRPVLTYDEVEREFARTAAASEPVRPPDRST